ncbi:MAG TPA: hypothetical protein PLT66_00065 [Bacillota bacterium]|nr:hypothetical protein [Bacillota bacterium]
MKISDIQRLLGAELLTKTVNTDQEVFSACGSDMMSDVLAFVKEQGVLLTGLVNCQVVRTADMMDMVCVVFVRGKKPSPDIIALAEDCGIAVLATGTKMFEACGILYTNGLHRK